MVRSLDSTQTASFALAEAYRVQVVLRLVAPCAILAAYGKKKSVAGKDREGLAKAFRAMVVGGPKSRQNLFV